MKKSLIEQYGEYSKLYEQARMKLDAAINSAKSKTEVDTVRMNEDDQKALFYTFGDGYAEDVLTAYNTFNDDLSKIRTEVRPTPESEDNQRSINPESSDT